MNHSLAKRLDRLERQEIDTSIRAVIVHPGEPEPVPVPGEHLIVLHARDMGEVPV